MNNHNDSFKADHSLITLHFQITELCKVGCVGCYQSKLNHDSGMSKTMTKEDIIYNINKLMKENLEKFPEALFKLSFFGGEPLYQYNLIKEVLLDLPMLNIKNKISIVTIPTSAYTTKIFNLNRIKDLNDICINQQIKLKVSISYDGPLNKMLRNTEPEFIKEQFKSIDEYYGDNKINPLSDIVSTVIPNNSLILDENWMINTYEDIKNNLNRSCTFTIPHIVNDKNYPKAFKISLNKFINTYQDQIKQFYLTSNNKDKLPNLIVSLIEKIKSKHGYNYCGAGSNHFAVDKNGISICEYLDTKNINFHLKELDKKCSKCEIKDYCQRPCLKNVENDLFITSFNNQCLIRKILFNEIKKLLQ